jgi:hypothetical protein
MGKTISLDEGYDSTGTKFPSPSLVEDVDRLEDAVNKVTRAFLIRSQGGAGGRSKLKETSALKRTPYSVVESKSGEALDYDKPTETYVLFIEWDFSQM